MDGLVVTSDELNITMGSGFCPVNCKVHNGSYSTGARRVYGYKNYGSDITMLMTPLGLAHIRQNMNTGL